MTKRYEPIDEQEHPEFWLAVRLAIASRRPTALHVFAVPRSTFRVLRLGARS